MSNLLSKKFSWGLTEPNWSKESIISAKISIKGCLEIEETQVVWCGHLELNLPLCYAKKLHPRALSQTTLAISETAFSKKLYSSIFFWTKIAKSWCHGA